jgi:hypothetical protein
MTQHGCHVAGLVCVLFALTASAVDRPTPPAGVPMAELLAASIYGSPDVDIAVPNGSYTLQLLLYEGWKPRSADIVIEGMTVREKYDMLKEQGGTFRYGSVLRHTFTLVDGNIDIEIKGPLHLGGLILSKENDDSSDQVKIVKSQAALDLKAVIKAINFGDTKDVNLGDVKFTAAAVNTTVDGVTNKATGDVYAGEHSQKRPQMERLQAIFNGKDLTGWDGDPKTWHVEDGAICCSGKAGNTWLIWRGGTLENFELRLQFRHLSGNSGVQVRSIEDKKWSVVGYQAEVAAQEQMGLWHHSKAPEKYRFALSNAGEKGHISKDGVKTLTRFASAEKVRKAFRPGEWNEMVIVGRGPRLIQTVNGVVLSELVDLDGKHATSKGLLALQDHGNGTVVHYKDIYLKVLSAESTIKEAAAKERAREKAIKAAVMNRNRSIRAKDELPPYLKSASSNSQLDPSRQRPFDETFIARSGDVIAFIGASQTVLQQRYGYLETLLTRADAEKGLRFRNLAWQADTVYRRQRPRNFGGDAVQLRRVDASIIIAAFGQIEAMDGVQEIPAFVAAYRKLLTECATQTRRIVLITPLPFGKIDNPHIPDLTLHNDAVAAYAVAIRKLAEELDCLCVDLSQRHAEHDKANGMHLTALGQFQLAQTTYQTLQGTSTKPISVDADGHFNDSGLEELREAVLAKNELWFRHWRPSNWGFLYGNRQRLAFSRDNNDLNKRLLPAEITGILPMLKDAEAAIAEKRK